MRERLIINKQRPDPFFCVCECVDKKKVLKGLRKGSIEPDIPDGLVLTGLFFLDVESGLFSDEYIKNYYKGWLSYRSHYGDLQWWHAMQSTETSAAAVQVKIVNLVVERAAAFRSNAATNPEAAGRLLGFALHTIEDSFSKSHVVRGENGSIIRFQNYSAQDSHKHGEADKMVGSDEYNKAVDAVRGLLDFVICGDGDEAALRKLLDGDILRLSPDAAVGGREPSYAK